MGFVGIEMLLKVGFPFVGKLLAQFHAVVEMHIIVGSAMNEEKPASVIPGKAYRGGILISFCIFTGHGKQALGIYIFIKPPVGDRRYCYGCFKTAGIFGLG